MHVVTHSGHLLADRINNGWFAKENILTGARPKTH